MCIYAYVRVRACMCVCVCMFVYAYVRVRVRACINIYIYAGICSFDVSVFVCDTQMHLKDALDAADFIVVVMQKSLHDNQALLPLLRNSTPWQRFLESNMRQ